jgi:hypothetical protein
VIKISERMVISKRVTILGQTAPGDGITVYGNRSEILITPPTAKTTMRSVAETASRSEPVPESFKSAPGDGITVYGNGWSFSNADDAIVRYIRMYVYP